MDTPRTPKPADRTRRKQGQFEPEPDTAEQDAQVYRLYRDGMTFEKIAAHMGISKTTAVNGYHRVVNAPRLVEADGARQLERDRLQAALERCAEREASLMEMLRRKNILVQQGKVIYSDTGETIDDVDLAIKIHAQITAIERLRDQTHQRIVDLDGLKVNPSQNVNMQVAYIVKGLDDD